MPDETQLATFGGGCFWCIEAVFERLPGVQSVTSGYAGGKTPTPSYDTVCSGVTGHAEVVQIEFNPEQISYEDLLDVFWQAHDPTTPNRQGGDSGTQYRSIILYSDDTQRESALQSRKKAQARLTRPIVTEIEPLREFHPAEPYHQDYFRRNSSAPYCFAVIHPKLQKLETIGAIPSSGQTGPP